jgi:hypothetical protein
MFGAPGIPELIIVVFITLLTGVVFVFPATIICRKAGLSGYYSLIPILPFGVVLFLFVLAFSDWPTVEDNTFEYK